MASYYLDTSALVKAFAREQGTAWVSALVDPSAGHTLYTVRLTGPEMVAPLTFVSADRVQRQAAAAEGLPVDDPNIYP